MAMVDYQRVVREAIKHIGYDDSAKGEAGSPGWGPPEALHLLEEQMSLLLSSLARVQGSQALATAWQPRQTGPCPSIADSGLVYGPDFLEEEEEALGPRGCSLLGTCFLPGARADLCVCVCVCVLLEELCSTPYDANEETEA